VGPFADYPQLALAYHSMPILPRETLDKPGDPSGRYQWEGYRDGAYGRFRPTKWSPGVSVEMERNPDFFMKGLPYLDGVNILIVPEESTFMAQIRAGKIDSGLTRDPTVIADNARMKDVQQEVCPYAGALRGFMNTNRPEFKDVNVRRAISMAIDREALNKVVFQGLGKDLYSIMTLALGRQWAMDRDDYPPEVRRYLTYDVKAAKELMAQSAYPNGFTTKIIYWPKMAGTRPTAEALSSMLADIGIELKLEEVTREGYISVIRGYPWDKPDTPHTGLLIGLIYWVAVDNLWDYTHSTSVRNRSAINDPKLDAMLEEQRRTVDVAKRQQIVRDIQTYLVDKMYMLPLPTGPHAEVHQPYVKGFYFKTYGWYDAEVMRDAWMEK